MLIKRSQPAGRIVRPSEITPEAEYRNYSLTRRQVLAAGAALPFAGAAGAVTLSDEATTARLSGVAETPFSTDEPLTPFKDVTTYNNFYEFGLDKRDPAKKSGDFEPKPWTVEFAGECDKPGTVDYDALLTRHGLEERIYRLRCVEAWSMVVPWIGIPLAKVLEPFAPNSRAKYVAFETIVRPEQMPGQKRRSLPWPYVEGLRVDEAMHPLTLLAVGLYGHELPNQNGAPIRLVVPWKYGFKCIKSIVKITFTEKEPPTTWNIQAPNEYGFYANVNPDVDHPRWSQARERRIGDFFKRETLFMNGYADEVAGLYADMDLRKHY